MMHERLLSVRRRWLAIVLMAGSVAATFAQAPQGNSGAKASPQSNPQAPAGTAPRTAVQSSSPVSQDQAVYLVRATLLTLNDANRSGNYTVLRDLAAPDFQAKNTAADLAQDFADLRRRNFDLFAVALLAPQFAAAPALDANGLLRLKGFFATRPSQINFDLAFQNVSGHWRLIAIAVATPAAPATQSRITVPPQHTSKPFYGFRVLSGIVGWRW